MKKRILTVLILAAVLSSCGKAPEIDTEPAESVTEAAAPEQTSALPDDADGTEENVQTEPPAPESPVDLSAAPFRIVTSSSTSSAQLTTVMNAFTTRLKSPPFASFTTVGDGTDPADGAAEIVIGNSSRPGATEIAATLGPVDCCVVVRGGRIFVAGGAPDAVSKALYWLLTEYVAKGVAVIPAGEIYRYDSEEKMPEIPAAPPYTGSALNGITVYAIGDSYFAGEGLNPKTEVWPALLAKKYGQTFENYGVGGSTVSDYNGGGNPMCKRISAMKAGDPDLILFEGGANDWNHSVPLGDSGSRDTLTFRGAVASCIEQLHAKYPRALIVCISCWDYGTMNSQGRPSTVYAAAMCEVAASYSYCVPVNASDTSVIPAFMWNGLFRAAYSITQSDRSHLNREGMKTVLPFFEKIIGDSFESFARSGG